MTTQQAWKLIKESIESVVGIATAWLFLFARLVAVALIAALLVRYTKTSWPFVSPPSATELAYLCGCIALLSYRPK